MKLFEFPDAYLPNYASVCRAQHDAFQQPLLKSYFRHLIDNLATYGSCLQNLVVAFVPHKSAIAIALRSIIEFIARAGEV